MVHTLGVAHRLRTVEQCLRRTAHGLLVLRRARRFVCDQLPQRFLPLQQTAHEVLHVSAIALQIVGAHRVDVGDNAIGRLGGQQDACPLYRILGTGAHGAVGSQSQSIRNNDHGGIDPAVTQRRRRRFCTSGDISHPFDVDVLHRKPRVGEDLRQIVHVRTVGLHGDGLAPEVAGRSDVALHHHGVAARRPRQLIDHDGPGARVPARDLRRHVDHAERPPKIWRSAAQIRFYLLGENVFARQ